MSFNPNNNGNAGGSLFGGAPKQGGLFDNGGAPKQGGLFGAGAGATGSSGAFGAGSGNTITGFGGGSQPGQTLPAAGLFGGGDKSAQAPAGAGLFGGGAQPPAGAGLFGGGAKPANAPAGVGLFGGGSQPTQAPAGAGLFGGAKPATANTTAVASGSLFGGASQSAPKLGGLLGASGAQQPNSTGMFGGGSTGPSAPSAGGLFGGSGATNNSAQPAPSGLFGQKTAQQEATKPAQAPNMFGGGAKPAQAPAGAGLFGGAKPADAPAANGLFGGASKPAESSAGGNLFGGAQPSASPAGGNLFGGAPKPAETNPTSNPQGGLFGKDSASRSSDQAPLVSGLLGQSQKNPLQEAAKPAQASNMFGGGSQPVQAAAGAMFGGLGTAKKPDDQQPKAAGLFGKPDQSKAPQLNLSQPVSGATGPQPAIPLNAESQKLTDAANKANQNQIPGQNQNQPNAAQTELDKYHKKFQQETLNTIGERWKDQLRRNEGDFDKCTKQLQEYELNLLKQIKSVEQVQNGSNALLSQYKHNIQDLTDVQAQQTSVINELKNIELELDALLPNDDEFQHVQMQAQDEPEVPLRKQVHDNATKIDNEIDEVQSKLTGLTNDLNEQTQRNKKDNVMNLQALQVGSNQEMQDNVKATQEMEEILGVYYDTLQWIQSSAIDLQYQTQELEHKINSVQKSSQQY